jgi:hypothetical protein
MQSDRSLPASEVLVAIIIIIALIMEAAVTSETSVNFYQTTLTTTQKRAIFILTAM